jgi:hypothetical protein
MPFYVWPTSNKWFFFIPDPEQAGFAKCKHAPILPGRDKLQEKSEQQQADVHAVNIGIGGDTILL